MRLTWEPVPLWWRAKNSAAWEVPTRRAAKMDVAESTANEGKTVEALVIKDQSDDAPRNRQ